ncbi:hypothetical protein Tco_0109322 [Tanacetum coccineum]
MATDDVQEDDTALTQDRSKWFKEDVVVRPETPDPEWNKNQMMFPSKQLYQNCLHKEKITKSDLEGPTFKLLKGKYKNYIKLEYNFEECYRALTDHIDWINPVGERVPYDLSKPLPLHDPLGRTTIPVDFFFNKDLEYLKNGSTERRYDSLLTKPKAARLSIDKQFGYGYLKEIIVRRENQKEYIFNEADFKRLHLNDIEDIIVLKKRVKDVQLRVESYQTKLNITRPQYLMRIDEMHKFSDEMLKPVQDILNERLHNLALGYNAGMQIELGWKLIRKEQLLCFRRLRRRC